MGLSNGKGDIFGALFFRGAQKADPLRGHMVRYRTNKEKKDFGFKMTLRGVFVPFKLARRHLFFFKSLSSATLRGAKFLFYSVVIFWISADCFRYAPQTTSTQKITRS